MNEHRRCVSHQVRVFAVDLCFAQRSFCSMNRLLMSKRSAVLRAEMSSCCTRLQCFTAVLMEWDICKTSLCEVWVLLCQTEAFHRQHRSVSYGNGCFLICGNALALERRKKTTPRGEKTSTKTSDVAVEPGLLHSGHKAHAAGMWLNNTGDANCWFIFLFLSNAAQMCIQNT